LSSRPGFPVTQHRTRQRVRLSVRKGACSSRNPPTSTGNPGERSRGICSSADLSWKCFPTERTRISCCAAVDRTACAAFLTESRTRDSDWGGAVRNPGSFAFLRRVGFHSNRQVRVAGPPIRRWYAGGTYALPGCARSSCCSPAIRRPQALHSGRHLDLEKQSS
jgi:hypothetical protein